MTVKNLKDSLKDIDDDTNVYVGCNGYTNYDSPVNQYGIEVFIAKEGSEKSLFICNLKS